MTSQLRRARRALAAALATAACLTLAPACKSNLTGGDLTDNPNAPSKATINEELVAVTAISDATLTADDNRVISIWMRQMAGTGRQWLTYDGPYIIDENSFGSFSQFYTGGGLIDIRTIQAKAKAANDRLYLGIGEVWEALVMGYVADWWGDIPYRQASNPSIATPALDPQQQVYADLQKLLDAAVADLQAGGTGPHGYDLIYNGDAAKWTALAHTLKARLYLHVAERDPAAYASALAQAQLGIADASGDFRTYQSSTVGEENQWFQFARGRGTDISAGSFLVNLLSTRNAGGADARLTQYFGPSGTGTVVGADPGQEGETYSYLSSTRGDPGFRQPLVTAAENTLIRAEARLQTGDQSGAAADLNAERATAGLPAVATGLTVAQLYQQIIEEKYVALFQNPEVWSDWKRTCWPNFAPANGARVIPARFFYGADERGTNPNIPSPSAAPRRNWNDPPNATALDGNPCLGQG
ncbi:MAG TPA: SusD/RagB family nutrient-binding outer membrane lipoprotein [Gemmatirosa sp.]